MKGIWKPRSSVTLTPDQHQFTTSFLFPARKSLSHYIVFFWFSLRSAATMHPCSRHHHQTCSGLLWGPGEQKLVPILKAFIWLKYILPPRHSNDPNANFWGRIFQSSPSCFNHLNFVDLQFWVINRAIGSPPWLIPLILIISVKKSRAYEKDSDAPEKKNAVAD